MPLSAKKLEDALLQGTYDIYRQEPDATTVNKVRKHVEETLSLDEGFFSSGQWKSRSKELIKERVGKLFDGWVPEEKTGTDLKTSTKRSPSDTEAPETKPKRQKRASDKTARDEPDLSSQADEEKPRKRKRKTAPGRKNTLAESEEDEEDDSTKPEISSPVRKIKLKDVSDEEEEWKTSTKADIKGHDTDEEEAPIKKRDTASDEEKPDTLDETEDEAKVSLDVKPTIEDEDDYSDVTDEPAKPKRRKKSKGDAPSKKPVKQPDDVKDEVKVAPFNESSITAVNEEEEYSDVFDEPPKPKRKKKVKDEPPSKRSKAPKSASNKASEPDDPNEAEIKKLQGQLVKCGIRKLWHNELKKYGDDSRAKIRHLKKMLTDVGMDGRFSEAKAREIKEMRELAAEAEAAQEMNALWGTGGPDRASRSKAKTAIAEVKDEDSASGSEDTSGSEDKSEEEVSSFAARRRRAQADLAFLGDDSDSD